MYIGDPVRLILFKGTMLSNMEESNDNIKREHTSLK
jgi:hypothetical protein